MSPELLSELKRMDAAQILMTVSEAKSGNRDVYQGYIPEITRRDALEWLGLFIRVAEEGEEFRVGSSAAMEV